MLPHEGPREARRPFSRRGADQLPSRLKEEPTSFGGWVGGLEGQTRTKGRNIREPELHSIQERHVTTMLSAQPWKALDLEILSSLLKCPRRGGRQNAYRIHSMLGEDPLGAG